MGFPTTLPRAVVRPFGVNPQTFKRWIGWGNGGLDGHPMVVNDG